MAEECHFLSLRFACRRLQPVDGHAPNPYIQAKVTNEGAVVSSEQTEVMYDESNPSFAYNITIRATRAHLLNLECNVFSSATFANVFLGMAVFSISTILDFIGGDRHRMSVPLLDKNGTKVFCEDGSTSMLSLRAELLHKEPTPSLSIPPLRPIEEDCVSVGSDETFKSLSEDDIQPIRSPRSPRMTFPSISIPRSDSSSRGGYHAKYQSADFSDDFHDLLISPEGMQFMQQLSPQMPHMRDIDSDISWDDIAPDEEDLPSFVKTTVHSRHVSDYVPSPKLLALSALPPLPKVFVLTSDEKKNFRRCQVAHNKNVRGVSRRMMVNHRRGEFLGPEMFEAWHKRFMLNRPLLSPRGSKLRLIEDE